MIEERRQAAEALTGVEAVQKQIADHIEATPGVCGGRPRIAGHRIRVQDIVNFHEAQGLSPDEIVDQFPQITLADVYAALAYYHDHCDEIRKEIADDRAFAERFRRENPSKIVTLNGRDCGADSLSS